MGQGMIAHFALMGGLYQYDPYGTESSLWNSYPWQIGAGSGLNVDAHLPSFSMSKTTWAIGEIDSPLVVTEVMISDFSMFSTLISVDNFGHTGEDIGSKPTPFPYKIAGLLGGGVVSITSIAAVKDIDTDQTEQSYILPSSGSVISIESIQTLVHVDSHSEAYGRSGTLSPASGSVVSIISNQV